MPNFKGRRFTNAHETLIWAAKNRASSNYTFNYEAMKALNDELQMRSDWTLPICAGHERLKDADGEKAHSTQKPEALLHRVIAVLHQAGRCDPRSRSSVRAPPARWPSGWAAASSASNARRPMPMWRAPASPRSTPADGDVIEVTSSKSAEPRIPFGWVVERGLLPPGTVLHGIRKAPRRQGARRRHPGVRRCLRLDPSDRRACAGAGCLQRLDLLAVRDERRAGADRCAAPAVCASGLVLTGTAGRHRQAVLHHLAHHGGQRHVAQSVRPRTQCP